MISRSVLIVAVIAHLVLGSHQFALAEPNCPAPTIIPISPPDVPTFPGPIPPGLLASVFHRAYTAWSDRLEKPDIALRSDPDAWTQVPEFRELRKKPFLPFILERMKAGEI